MQPQQLIDYWRGKAYPHQWTWFEKRHQSYRNYLVDRKMGTTLAMAVEAMVVYLETGRLQVFMAATKAQAEISKHYIDYVTAYIAATTKKPVEADKFHFCSPKMLCNACPEMPWDLYVADYLFLDANALRQVKDAVDVSKPVRHTWTTAMPNTLQFRLLLDAERVSQSS